MVQERKRRKALLLGVGLDNDDGHTRVTRGENFLLCGGSQDTHQQMTESAVKINEKLAEAGKQLHEVTRDDLLRIARDIGLSEAP